MRKSTSFLLLAMWNAEIWLIKCFTQSITNFLRKGISKECNPKYGIFKTRIPLFYVSKGVIKLQEY